MGTAWGEGGAADAERQCLWFRGGNMPQKDYSTAILPLSASGPSITAAGNTSPLNETWTDGDTGIQIVGTTFV